MHKRLVFSLTLLFVVLFATPVWADVNLNINGKVYEPANAPQLEQGTTMVPVYVIGRVLGADISATDQNITIRKSSNTLLMTVGSTKATFNGQEVTLPMAPQTADGEVMVPLRYIYEAFGATVEWQGQDKTVAVNYSEKRQGMGVDEMLVKSSDAMTKFNTYKMKIDMTMQANGADPKSLDQNKQMDIKSHMILAAQQNPVLIYGKTSTVIPGAAPTDATEAVDSELLMNEDGMYMTMPGQGWVKFDIPGMDIKALMKQSGSQDPLESLKQMKEYGVVLSFADDQEKDGKSYWVINVTMGADSLSKVMGEAIKKVPVTENKSDDKNSDGKDIVEGISDVMTDLFKDLEADIVYNVWIDQTTYLPSVMELDAKMKMKIPAVEGSEATTMNMSEKANYEIYDLGLPFTVPDVSKAVDMKEFLEKQSLNPKN